MLTRMTRRAASIRLVAKAALLWGVPVSTFGRDGQDSSLREAIATAIGQGEELRSAIVDGPVPVSPWATRAAELDLTYRTNLALAFQEASPQDARTYVVEGFQPVYEFVVAADAPLYPSEADVATSRINTGCREAPEEDETVQTILFDIIVEALGMPVDRSLFQQFLEQNNSAREMFEQLVNAISTQNWSQMAARIDEFLWWMIVGGGVQSLAGYMRGQGAATGGMLYRIGWRLSVRFVPFVGWLYLGGAIVLAIKANFHRFSGNAADAGC